MYRGWEGCQENKEVDDAREGGGRREDISGEQTSSYIEWPIIPKLKKKKLFFDLKTFAGNRDLKNISTVLLSD